MPVTAKLSKKFYDTFGEEVANELVDWFNQVDATYRADLRELNELNFARFDAKLEQRMAEVKAELRQELAGLRTDVRTEIARLEGRLDAGLHALKADLFKWMIGAWATLLGAMVALHKL